MKVSIRDYRKGDFEAVNRLWIDTDMGGTIRGDDEKVILRTIMAGGRLRIMTEPATDKIIGTSWLTTDHRRLYLHHFGISPEVQGKGLSKILLEDSLHLAKDFGLQVKLEVHRSNTIATELYKKYGFKDLGDYLVLIIRDLEKM